MADLRDVSARFMGTPFTRGKARRNCLIMATASQTKVAGGARASHTCRGRYREASILPRQPGGPAPRTSPLSW
jgi:hypothetical protein